MSSILVVSYRDNPTIETGPINRYERSQGTARISQELRNQAEHGREPHGTNAQPRRLSRSAINFLLDSLLLCLFCGIVITTCILRFVFPPVAEVAESTLWGLSFGDWANVQVAIVGLFGLSVVLHLVLHWTWVCGFVSARMSRVLRRPVVLDDGPRTLYGVSLLVLFVTLLIGTLGLAVIMIKSPS